MLACGRGRRSGQAGLWDQQSNTELSSEHHNLKLETKA